MSKKPTPNRLFDISIPTTDEQIDDKLSNYTRNELFIAIPATVLRVDEYESSQVVDVQPVFDLELIDDRIVTAPVFKKVFVKIPSGGGFSIKLPIAVGDLVTLQYAHKAISTWLDSDGGQLTQSEFHIAMERDCWVEHGFGTRKNNQSPSQTDLIIEGPNTTITIPPSGNLVIDTNGTSTVKSLAHTIDANTIVTGTLTVLGDVTVGEVGTPSNLTVLETGIVSSGSVSATTTVAAGTTVSGTTVSGTNGDFTTSLKVNTKELDGHTHDQGIDSAGDTQATTDGNN